jgi:pimeloyl-ACP methyl ester carboxylesterase
VSRGRTALLVTAVGLALAIPGSAQAKLQFRDCGEAACARLSVPLDHSGAVSGRLSLKVERHDTYDRTEGGVTLLLAGRPGQAATELYDDAWEAPGRDLIVFDQRGTGSGALRCRDLEAATDSDAGREAAACATLLGDRRRFFRTSDTVEDIEALRVQLGLERLTIVGSVYGAYVAQRYAMRYPERVERLLLESPVDAAGLDPLYIDSMAAVRRALPVLCRSGCRSFTSDALADTARLVERLAAEPLRGTIVGPTGHRRTAFLTGQELLYTLVAADDDFLSQPEYPAAVVSALRGDSAPILRMKRRALADPLGHGPRTASAATHAATLCEEVRFPWSWHATPAERDEAAYRTETAMDRSLAAPFDPRTLVRSDLMRLCRRWPTASEGPPPDPGKMPDVPVLVLSAPGGVGSSLESARRTAARFPRGQLLETPGLWPSLGFVRNLCGGLAAERFLRGQRVQERCPRGTPLLAPAAPVPVSLSELKPDGGVPGRRGRLLHALSVTFGDLVDSFYLEALQRIGEGQFEAGLRGGGLRGGSYAITEDAFRLDRYEFVPGVRFSSRWRTQTGSNVLGGLHIDGPGALDGVLQLRESDDLIFAVRGRLAGRRVRTKVRIRSRLLDLFNQLEVEDGGGSARLVRRVPNVPGDAPGSCRFPPLRHGPGPCALR